MLNGVSGIAAAVVGAVAFVVVAGRQRIARRLRAAGAADEATGVALPSVRPLDGWWKKRLLGEGVLGETPDGRLWLDEPLWKEYRARRRRRAVTVLVPILLMLATILAWIALGE